MGGQTEVEDVFEVGETAAEVFPVLLAGFDEGRQALQLDAADGRLRVEWLQIITQMTVEMF